MTILFSILSLITFVVVLNSVIFSCKNVSAFCINYSDLELEQEVVDAADISRAQNIFFLSPNKIKERVESQIVNVEVIKTERIFTNTVIIHFAKILDYFAIANGESYVIANHEGKVTLVTSSVDLDNIIEVKLRGAITDATINKPFISSMDGEREILAQILDALYRLGYHEKDRISLISQIDLSNPEYIIIQMRTGVKLMLIGSNLILEKMQYAITIYTKSDSHKHNGIITVYYNNETANVEGTYNAQP